MRPQSIRVLMISAVTLLITGILAVIGVGVGPATANHGDLALQASPELGSAATGTAITVTATLDGDATTPIEIDAEIESGPADSGDDVNGADAPDQECTVPAGQDACSFTVTSNVTGKSTVRLWIDHDGKNAVGEGGVTEADLAEARLANADPDTIPTGGTTVPPHADCRQPEDFPAGRLDANACGDGTPNAGARGDSALSGPDDTDVIELSWAPGATRLNCEWDNGGDTIVISPANNNATVTCTVVDVAGAPVSDVFIDAENLSSIDGEENGDGANDPDNGSADPADYGMGEDDFGQPIADELSCQTGTDGSCTFDIEPVRAESGPAVICFWIDKRDGEDPDAEDDYDLAGSANDGGDCDNELVEDSENDDVTDSLRVRWASSQPVATTLDLSPETASVTTGGTHSIQARILDQFGEPFADDPMTVNFELTDPSPSDQDGNTAATPDRTCRTGSTGACGIALESDTAGTDIVCGWFGAAPAVTNNTCGGETAADGNNVGRIDVVTRSWTAPPVTPPAPDKTAGQGYVLVGGDGGIFNYGAAEFHGSTGSIKLNQPIIGIAYMPGGKGYWLVAKDGGVFTFGAAKFHGSMGDKKLNAPVLGIESTPSGGGYWLFAADGGIFSFGDATFHGSTGNLKLNSPVVGMAVTEAGDGYWLVASDGGVFSFDAPFHGSTGSMKLNQPVFDMAPGQDDEGYWLVARDGGVFTFGDSPFYGSAANTPGRDVVVGMGDTPSGAGYWIGDVNGKVMPFGDAKFLGDRSATVENSPMVAFASVQPVKNAG